MSFLLVALGGFMGSILRAFISIKMHKKLVATWLVNILGSAILGFVFRLYSMDQMSESIYQFWGIGFSGAFTTFSTFSVEVVNDLIARQYLRALAYIFLSFTIALIIVFSIVYI